MRRVGQNKNGFTVVELLIVISVIGVLSAIILNVVSGTQAKARDSERAHEAGLIRRSLEAHKTINGYYPDSSTVIGTLPELDPDAMTDPNGVLMNDTGANYVYAPDSCNGTECDEFTLTVTRETDIDIVYVNP